MSVLSRWQRPTADRLVLMLGALVLVLAAASNDDSSGIGDARTLDVLAVLLLAGGVVLVVAGGRFPAAAAAAAMFLTFAWYGAGYVSGESWWEGLTAAGYVVMAVLFGELIRSRRLLVERHAAEAAQLRRDAQRRIAEERLHIARDVHDVLAHTISSMTVQAGVAADAIDRDDQAVRDALASIRHAGRAAMQELRATVSLLRSGDDAVSTSPAPRLARIGELVNVTREHGIDVGLVLDPPALPLPELVELTAYRIVQESLTNVLRHADASRADVSVTGDSSSLTIEIHDDGRAPAPATPGFGLRGMAERVESIGGQLWHGIADDGGWTVRAHIPLGGGGT